MANNAGKENATTVVSNHQNGRQSWLWLVTGLVLLPFTFYQTVIPLAAWLAPIFLLRFARTARRASVVVLLIFCVYAFSIIVGLRGSDTGDAGLLILGIIVFPVIRGCVYTLPYAADRLLRARATSWGRLLAFPLAFTTVDWLMSLSRIINSTGSPAYSQAGNLPLIQVISISGMWGITFLIMWCAAWVNELWEYNFDWLPLRTGVIAFPVVLLVIVLSGSARLAFAPPRSPAFQAAAITQDNRVSSEATSLIDVNLGRSTDAKRTAIRQKLGRTFDVMLGRTETTLRGGAKLVSWEESAAFILEEDEQQALGRVAALARQYEAYLQVSFGLLTRTDQQTFIRNQSILVDDTGAIRWSYDKTYPVFPVESYVTIPGNGILPLVETPYGRLSTAICNDLHFAALIRQAGQNGVDILLAPYHDLHPFEAEDAVVATYRAVENGFSLIRPAGQGISTIVDYEGRSLSMQNYDTAPDGIMIASLSTRGVTTIYSRVGDLFAYLCVVGLVYIMAKAIVFRRDPYRSPGDNPYILRKPAGG